MTGAGEPAWAPGSFLDLISAAERDELFALGATRRLPAGRTLLAEGHRDTQVELLREGQVKVTRQVGGVPRLLAIRLPGDIVGEFAAFTGSERTATVTTCGDVVSTVIRQRDFMDFVGKHPNVAVQVAATIGRRLRWANERRTEFSAFPAHVRLARVLLEIATSCGEAVDDGVRITVDLSQTELAYLIGAREDTVQRALRQLRADRLLRTGYRRIVVLDEDGLRDLVEHAEWT
ncbi:CRP-like cAMP-binding protein [Actinoplanes octamycinicus]|uniref:CRP-like cAMP-binding protein n=1 Tax=Actinoplanes octamycinicus TaxID=135948 RepID=A0A7W7MCF7_9ACTN|nr:Crp/Fnr family transcriptional regulator [Actinoplanes octamycinicus]MBB4745068.1 CRP-like cAMP-binding protein [Actinoplanes octamycinicus]GIE55654.1 Crp/Fnr family transcriptional regulator [Actinoplanes octamycinicus]